MMDTYEIFVNLRINRSKVHRYGEIDFSGRGGHVGYLAAKGRSYQGFLESGGSPRAPYTTVASIVKNLEKKGYVCSKRYGNTYVYTPAIDENEYKNRFLSGVVVITTKE